MWVLVLELLAEAACEPVHRKQAVLALGVALRSTHCSSSSHACHASCIRSLNGHALHSLGTERWYKEYTCISRRSDASKGHGDRALVEHRELVALLKLEMKHCSQGAVAGRADSAAVDEPAAVVAEIDVEEPVVLGELAAGVAAALRPSNVCTQHAAAVCSTALLVAE